MKIAVFWVVAYFYQTTRCYNPEDSNLQGRTAFINIILISFVLIRRMLSFSILRIPNDSFPIDFAMNV
jgi:hypothetical protein